MFDGSPCKMTNKFSLSMVGGSVEGELIDAEYKDGTKYNYKMYSRTTHDMKWVVTVDFRNFIVFLWAETLAHWNPTSRQKNIHI